MKKNVKVISALLILVMLMAQVVCINAATVQPNVSYSTKQIDHFEKTCTVTLTKVQDVSHIWIAAYKEDKTTKVDEASKYVISDDENISSVAVSLDVRPNVAKYIHCTIHLDDGTEIDKWYSVGGNSYYNPGSTSANNGGSTYDGLVSSGSSNNYWTGSYGSNTNVWDTYDPNKWYGYYEDKEDYEVKEYDYYYVTCRSLNVRNGAGTWADKVGSLKRYDKVKVYDIEDNWAVIEYKGRLRYVSARYIDEL